ncbi:hypothetical protein PENCOP_c007G02766 [Penicillium coprophilum]|uniref:ferric-chelate reductase (NADPH) n=1 Tax=Penicillium coprophilum TaxID=36646 RepID=A0A1V6ULN4_9EURO|nr:hypothetical protein PENCOP_c007G02766 [Penicillium coprophilum]
MMEMEAQGTPWLDQPVMLHSSRADKCKLTEAQCLYRNYRWRYWYQADHVYALSTVYFMCAVIGVFTISNLLMRLTPIRVKRTRPWRWFTSISRYLSYRGYRVPALRHWSPALGVMILGAVGAVFFFAMTLGPKPYYWPTDASYGSSPPIATRSGWMALALLPFVLALSTKANMISGVTGIPHEKLQVFHHWTSYAMFVLALIHTFPFYEFFKATHIFVAVVFVIFFFLHCDFRLSSWDYFIASGVIYFLSLIASHIRTYLVHGIHNATLELLPSGLVRVSVPSIIKWTPGQHVFVRFLTSDLHLLTAHPFTISSACRNPDEIGKASKIIFYIKPRDGVTGRLGAMAAKNPGCTKKILIEGPYGGVSELHMAQFDRILVIAGGSGGGFSLAMVDEALQLTGVNLPTSEKREPSRRNLQVVFSTRDHAMADWYIEEIESRLSESTMLSADSDNGFETAVSVHVTDQRVSEIPSTSESGDVKGTAGKMPPAEITTTGSFSLNVHRYARPDLPGLVAHTVEMAHVQGMHLEKKQRVGVLVCGPASMLHDTRNAAASAQARVFKGEVEELYLHSESFV